MYSEQAIKHLQNMEPSTTEAGKLEQSPQSSFCIAHELRMIFTFSNG